MKVMISPLAQQDLKEIKQYITNNLTNLIAAKNIIARIMKRIRMLEQSPYLGTPLSSIVDVETSHRYLLCGNYTVFYRVEEGYVYVDRVLYGRRDFMRILFGIAEDDDAE